MAARIKPLDQIEVRGRVTIFIVPASRYTIGDEIEVENVRYKIRGIEGYSTLTDPPKPGDRMGLLVSGPVPQSKVAAVAERLLWRRLSEHEDWSLDSDGSLWAEPGDMQVVQLPMAEILKAIDDAAAEVSSNDD